MTTTPSLKVQIFGPNVRFPDGVTFHVHAEGCADTKKGVYKHIRLDGDQGGWVETHTSLQSIVESVYSNMIDENGPDCTWEDGYVDDFRFFPCVTLPYAEPVEPEVAPTNRYDTPEFRAEVADQLESVAAEARKIGDPILNGIFEALGALVVKA